MDYAGWVADGSPYIDCTPNVELAAVLRGYGYTVYTRGDTRHMQASPPEDHTPFSATGWPDPSPYPYGHACDIMPPPAGSGLPSLAELGRQLFDDRTDEIPGAKLIKYMNWEPNGPGGPCHHDSWQPDHRRTSSTDRGHIHISWRSDATHKTISGYDPVARLRGDDMALDENQTAHAVWHVDGPNALANKYYPEYSDSPAHTPPGDNEYISGASGLIRAYQIGQRNADAIAEVAAAVEVVIAKVNELLARPVDGGDASGVYAVTGQLTIDREPA